jgi:hypothetical protein
VRTGRICVLIACLAAFAAFGGSAQAATFSNPALIAVPVGGPANPYPSTINVSGLSGTVSKTRASLVGITGSDTNHLQVILVGPAGQTTMLMRESCGFADPLAGEVFTFDDAAPGFLPFGTCQGLSGNYKPTDHDPANDGSGPFPPPAPPAPYGAALSVLNGSQPNGAWHLFVFEGNGGVQTHTIGGGWSLELETTAPAATAPIVSPRQCKKGFKLKKVKTKSGKTKKKCVRKKRKRK